MTLAAPCVIAGCLKPALPTAVRCEKHERKRNTQRRNARRRRERAHLDALKTATRCPKRFGVATCNGPLRFDVGEHGTTVATCDWCERQRRGVCRDCARPVVGQRGRA